MTLTYAVVPSFGRECLDGCLESLVDQVDLLFLVRTSEEFTVPDIGGGKIVAIDDADPPKNIQRWWNLGIAAAAAYAKAAGQEQWNVLVTNDDIIACPHLTETLDREMRATTAVLAYPNAFDDRRVLLTQPNADVSTRITGWCFMLRGESGLKTDEQFEWWYGDNDLDFTARLSGGALCVPGCAVVHLSPGETTSASAELTARTHVDRQLFLAKWNGYPH